LANKCFDYIQAEVPALHMDFPEYRSLVEKYPVAILLKELSPETIVSTINTLKRDEPRYNALVNECKQVKKNFTWQLEAQKLLTLYRDI